MRIHTDLLPDTLVRHTGLPRPHVEQTTRRLKAGARISSGRPYAPPLTPRDIARLVLALSAPRSGTAVVHEREIGRLPLQGGSSADTAEAALVAIAEAAIGLRPQPFDLDDSEIVIGQMRPSLEIRSRQTGCVAMYGADNDATARTYFHLPIAAVAAIARELLKD